MVLKQLFGKKGDTAKTSAQVPPHADTAKPLVSEHTQAGAVAAGASASDAAPGSEPAPALYLEQAMVENARSDNADTRRKVYQELLFSDLLLALAEPDGEAQTDGETESSQKDPNNLSVAILTNSGGTQFAAAFTSAASARRWRAEGGQYVSVRGQDIFKLLEPSPAEVIVINAGSAPFIVLPKIEYRQLAMGIVPQGGPSPVQVAASGVANAPDQNAAAAADGGDGQMQVAFPPDVFNENQKAQAREVMSVNPAIEAAVLGAILPPNAGESGWVRTVFLRVQGLTDDNADAMQQFCVEVRNAIVADQEIFNEINFEVGVMPDPNFWVAMHQNNIVLFDKNPPEVPKADVKEGVLDASV